MSLKELSQEQIDEISMIELATIILEEEREAIDFNEVFNRISSMKGYSEQQKENYIAQFYTDMNIDGRFMTIGTNKWGLKRWYPVEQLEEEIANLPQKRKKKKKKKPSKLLEDELGISEFDEENSDDLEEDIDLTDEDLDLDEEDDDYEGDYEDDDLDEEEEEIVEDDVSFVGDDDEDE